MAFLIPDNLKSRKDVPAAIRRVASAFAIGLDESAIVWFEPLYDPDDEKPHLVVLLPERGIIVLEVLDVKSSGLLGALRGRIRIQRDGKEIEVENPIVRADRLADALRARIVSESRLAETPIPVAAGAVFPGLAQDEALAKGIDRVLDAGACVFRSEIDTAITGSGGTDLLRAFVRMLGGASSEIPDHLESIIRGIIQPDIVITPVLPGTADSEDVVEVMDRNQEALAKSLGEGHRIVRGVAGSGKTVVLVHRARLLGRLASHQPILVTCYTRSLAGELRSRLQDHSNITVMNLDRIMASAIRQAQLRHPGFKDDPGGERVAEVALQALAKGAGQRYRAVLLDEAQDFGTNALRFAVGLLQPGSDDLIVVADAAQNIFRRRFSWRQAGIQAQGRTKILRVNYRNTEEILDFASRFLLAGSLQTDELPDPEDENTVIPPDSAMRNGQYPKLVVVRGGRDEVEAAVAQAREWAEGSKGAKSIGVLYADHADADGFRRADELVRGLRKDVGDVFWLAENSEAKDSFAEATEQVVLSTIQSAKGLEFRHVVLCGVWRDGRDADIETNRKTAYVGMTRATETLTVVTTKGSPLTSDLQAAIA